MSPTWNSDRDPPHVRITWRDWPRTALRASALFLLLSGGLALLLLVRLIERPVCKMHRPWTPAITQFVCRNAFRILGMGHKIQGDLMREPGGVVANHSSWLDILALNARKRIYFVSKSEVADWPAIGWLARATGTVFIRREAREAHSQMTTFEQRLKMGHKLLFFPEGTSTDSRRVLPFKSTLFAAFFKSDLAPDLSIQPVSVVYHAPPDQDPRFYGWWGDMDLAPHLLAVLSSRNPGSVELIYHPPQRVADFADRKALAKACETLVRSGVSASVT